MAFSYTINYEGRSAWGSLKVVIGTWDADSVTSGSIVTGLTRILHANVTDKTGNRADFAVDTTSTAGTVALSGVTANDVGTFLVVGK